MLAAGSGDCFVGIIAFFLHSFIIPIAVAGKYAGNTYDTGRVVMTYISDNGCKSSSDLVWGRVTKVVCGKCYDNSLELADGEGTLLTQLNDIPGIAAWNGLHASEEKVLHKLADAVS
jgi:hypothetical protein